MKVGDLVRYKYWDTVNEKKSIFGVILTINTAGGTLKVLDASAQAHWVVASYCEVISEGR